MTTLWLDTETYSETPIKDGTYRYAADCEIMVFTWAFDDGLVQCYDATETYAPPLELLSALRNPDVTLIAHNAMFDRNVIKYAWDIDTEITRWRDTMVAGLAHSLPAGLDKQGQILGIAEGDQKITDGKKLIQLFCKPRPKNSKIRRATRETNPEEWARFLEYAKADIDAMRAIAKRQPKWNYTGRELELWHLDQTINDRGIAIDLDLARAALRATDRAQTTLAADCLYQTNGEVVSATKRDQLLAHILLVHGIDLPDMQASTLERRLQDPDLDEGVKDLLRIRLQASSTSTSKYKTLLKSVSDDGRLRGTLQFDGAGRTRRDAGRTFQPQNLPSRGILGHEDIEFGIDCMKADGEDLFFDNVMLLATSALRGCIIAPPGKKLVVADLSNIEGRDVAWLAEEEWKLQAFRDFDAGTGPDLYKLAYAKSFGVDHADVTKDQRAVGKVMELACLGADTKVLTEKRGWIRLQSVTTQDRVWDGMSWAAHAGLVQRGVRQVVDVAGIALTPDHLIRTGKTWLPAQQLASSESILRSALETGSENLPSWATSSLISSIRGIAARFSSCKTGSQNSKRRMPVFDLAYCGPRECFTVLSDRGPLLVHNCGYAGGVGAFLTFSLAYGINLDDMADKVLPVAPGDVVHEAEGFYDWTLKKNRPTFGLSRHAFIASDVVKRVWRGAHPGVASLWRDLEEACKTATANPGETFPVRRFKVRRDGAWLRVQLPSGRCLCYPSPKIEEDGQLTYMGMNQYTRQWQRIKTHGGKLVENAAQSLARDVMFDNMPRIEAAGYEIVLRVHDEVVTEAPDLPEFSHEELSSLLATPHDWCGELPLAAAGFESQRYRK